MFIYCSTTGFGGAILGTSNCALTFISECFILECFSACCGGGISTHDASAGEVSSSRFISCKSALCGGGYYHFNYGDYSLTLSNSLFRTNTAEWEEPGRGGGGVEDYRRGTYLSKHLFLFFSDNSATTNQ